jgi:hypothetical protein
VSDRSPVAVLLLWAFVAVTATAAEPTRPPRMSVVPGKVVSGTIYKKLGLPGRQYCWDTCLKEDRCSGVRWGVVGDDTAGLCLLMTGTLSYKELVEPKTDDGKPIHVTAARKEIDAGGAT